MEFKVSAGGLLLADKPELAVDNLATRKVGDWLLPIPANLSEVSSINQFATSVE